MSVVAEKASRTAFSPFPRLRMYGEADPVDLRPSTFGLRSTRRRQPKRGPLLGPNHREVHQTLDAKTTRQASLDRRRDNRGRDKSQRKRHADRALGFNRRRD